MICRYQRLHPKAYPNVFEFIETEWFLVWSDTNQRYISIFTNNHTRHGRCKRATAYVCNICIHIVYVRSMFNGNFHRQIPLHIFAIELICIYGFLSYIYRYSYVLHVMHGRESCYAISNSTEWIQNPSIAKQNERETNDGCQEYSRNTYECIAYNNTGLCMRRSCRDYDFTLP